MAHSMSLLVAGTINGAPAIGVRGMAWTIKSIPSIRLAGDLGIADGTINLVRHNKGVPVCGVAPPNSRPKLLGGQAAHMVRKAHVRGVLDPSVWYAIRLAARPWGPPIIKPRIVGYRPPRLRPLSRMAQKELDILQNLMLQARLYVEGRPWKAANRLWSWLVVASSYLLDAASGIAHTRSCAAPAATAGPRNSWLFVPRECSSGAP